MQNCRQNAINTVVYCRRIEPKWPSLRVDWVTMSCHLLVDEGSCGISAICALKLIWFHLTASTQVIQIWCCTCYTLSKNTLPLKNIIMQPKHLRYLSTKQIPLCSPSSLPSNGPNPAFLVPLLAELAYLCMLFILQLTSTASSAGQLKHKNTVKR